jgi:hypothetical protein
MRLVGFLNLCDTLAHERKGYMANKHKTAPQNDQNTISNAEIAARLEEVAELLEAQQANLYRVRAYRRGAETIRALPEPVGDLLEREGLDALVRLPAIGRSLARSIEQLIDTVQLALLQRLRGDVRPDRVLMTVPGVGPKLAANVHEQLGIETLADLHAAAIDGRLATVPGFGPRRIQSVQESLSGRLRRPPPKPYSVKQASKLRDEPPVSELLDVDREYRKKASQDRLYRIAPRTFNPTGAAWLPILHTRRGPVHYTALFSNTARAHELGATQDWVVIYRDDENGDGRWTVITSMFGPLRGKRIVRGREHETRAFYEQFSRQKTT